MRQRRAQRGFTLIELMISLVIFSLAIASVLSVAVSMAQSFRQRRQLVHSEDNARSAMDYIADAIRNSGPAVAPTGGVRDDKTCTVMTGGISLTNGAATPDFLTVVVPAGGVVTSIANTSSYTLGASSFKVTDATGLSIGDQLMITDLTNADIVTVTNIVGTTISVAASSCSTATCSSSTTPACTNSYTVASSLPLVIRVVRAKFSIDQINANGFGVNTLLMDPDADGPLTAEPLAENVEDFQIALGYDTDSDNYVTSADNGGKPWIYDASTNVTVPAGATLRAVRLTLIVKNGEALPQTQSTALFTRPAAEDHAAATTPDWYPRRVLSSIVELRNYKGSP